MRLWNFIFGLVSVFLLNNSIKFKFNKITFVCKRKKIRSNPEQLSGQLARLIRLVPGQVLLTSELFQYLKLFLYPSNKFR